MTNISRSKGNQATIFGRLIGYNLKNIFLEKSLTKCGGETFRRPFFKKPKLNISLDQYSKFLYIFFFIVWQVEDCRNRLKLSCRIIAFNSNKAFLKNKKRSGNSLPATFSAWFLKKNISVFIFFYLTKTQFLVGCLSFEKYWAIRVL